MKPIISFTFIIAFCLLQATAVFAQQDEPKASTATKRKFVSLEEQMFKRASEIRIPLLELKDTTLADALDILRQEAKKRGPKHGGIQIISELKPAPVITSKTVVPPEGWPMLNPLDTRLTFSQRNISLAEALRHVVGLANCRVVPTVNGFLITPFTMGTDAMVTHTIPLPEEIFGKSAIPEKAGVSKVEIEKMRSNLKQYFIDSGGHFLPGASCSFNASGMTIIVTNTQDQIDLVHTVLEGLVQHSPIRKKK